MKNLVTKAVVAATLGATALTSATPADAQRYRHGYDHDDTGAAVVAGVAGLAIGAALASGDRGYYYEEYPAYPYPYYAADPYPYYYDAPYPYPYPYRYSYRYYGPRFDHYYARSGYRGGYGGYRGGGGYHGGGHHR